MPARDLLRLALPLIPTHGFTRHSLSLAALSLPKPYELSDASISALFGDEYEARRMLIRTWLDEGRSDMGRVFQEENPSATIDIHTNLKTVLQRRLKFNKPVLSHLPEAYALFATKSSRILLDPRPVIQHTADISDEALYLAGENATGTTWYTRRSAVALAYATAELHQINSPETAPAYLERTLDTLKETENAIQSVGEFVEFAGRGWKGLIKSQSLF